MIGVDKDIDTYRDGFSARVLFRSDSDYDERKDFVRREKKNLLLWIMHEIGENVVYSKQIGDINFYKPVEIVMLRIPEIEVKFEVKGA